MIFHHTFLIASLGIRYDFSAIFLLQSASVSTRIEDLKKLPPSNRAQMADGGSEGVE